LGNIVLWGGIGWAIDSALGADNKYGKPVNMTLMPETATKAAPQSSKLKTLLQQLSGRAPGS
jgi:hypothetical protein